MVKILNIEDNSNVEVVHLAEFSIDGIRLYLGKFDLYQCDFNADDPSGYNLIQNELNDILTVYDKHGAAQFFVGPAGSFKE